eukprot:1159518-Pelagomonas_calceolata.AAC.3
MSRDVPVCLLEMRGPPSASGPTAIMVVLHHSHPDCEPAVALKGLIGVIAHADQTCCTGVA